MTTPQTDNRGMILVFTLILLAVFLTTALGFAYFVIGDINKAKAIDDSIIAYYSADAGMEESLFLLKNQQLASDLEDLKNIRPGDQEMISSKGKWNIADSTNYEKTVLRQRIYNGQSVKFFILNRASGVNPTKSVTVEWHKGKDKAPQLQVNMTQLSSLMQDGTLVYYTDTSEVEVADYNTNGNTAKCYNLKDLDFSATPNSPASDYLVEVKVLGSNGDYVDRLVLRAYNNICGVDNDSIVLNPEGITNYTIKSKGVYGKSTQNIVAQILPKDPISGIFGFVLFSEQDVTKE